MIKRYLLLHGMMLPLDLASQAYLGSIKELKVCYPAALTPPYVTPDGGLLKDRALSPAQRQQQFARLEQGR